MKSHLFETKSESKGDARGNRAMLKGQNYSKECQSKSNRVVLEVPVVNQNEDWVNDHKEKTTLAESR